MLSMDTNTTRFNGTLKKWNAERGFGFLVADHGEQELFVHVSAFPRGSRLPTVGEALTFELELAPDGRKRAVRVRRPGDVAAGRNAQRREAGRAHGRRAPSQHSEPSSWMTRVVALLLVAGLGWYAYGQFSARVGASGAMSVPRSVMGSGPASPAAQVQRPAFRCDGRKYCSQMTSCEDAKLVLKNCPGTEMDGDHDGVPCEQQWCTGIFGN
jgi:cold shock CspA family protein